MDVKIIKCDINKFSSQKIRLRLENDTLKENKNLFPVKVYSFFSKIAQVIFGCKSISQHNLEYSLKYANSIIDEKKANITNNDICYANLEIKNIENTFKDYLNTNKGKNDKKRLENLKYKLSVLDNKLEVNEECVLELENINNSIDENVNILSKLDDEKDTTDIDEIVPNLTHDYLETDIEISISTSNKENNTLNTTVITENICKHFETDQILQTEFAHATDKIEKLFTKRNNFGIDFIIELQCFFSLIFNKDAKLITNNSISKAFSEKLNDLQKIFLRVKEVKKLNEIVLMKILKLWIDNQETIKDSLSNDGNLPIYHIVDENIKMLQNKIDANHKSWNSLVPYYKAIINSQRIQKITNIKFLI
ncbi:MAG TPA: hypothetical protein PKD00_02720 [Burkholderiales bacterium]|nr:hypothetical protein [Burkholderiales bacterium]